MVKLHELLHKIGIVSSKKIVQTKTSHSSEEKRRAARDYMRRKRAEEKKEGVSEAKLNKIRKQNRERMRRYRKEGRI